MWYEALPSGIICAMCATTIPYFMFKYLHEFTFGHPFRRQMRYIHQRMNYTRDERLTGAPWITAGLENIPDE